MHPCSSSSTPSHHSPNYDLYTISEADFDIPQADDSLDESSTETGTQIQPHLIPFIVTPRKQALLDKSSLSFPGLEYFADDVLDRLL